MGIRNAAKALVVQDNQILLVRYRLPDASTAYTLPGGGQQQYETIEEAVRRECLEETGYTVTIRRLAALFEEIHDDPQVRREFSEYAHKVHFVFQCELEEDIPPVAPTRRDAGQAGVEWVGLEEVGAKNLLPTILKDHLTSMLYTKSLRYLGNFRDWKIH